MVARCWAKRTVQRTFAKRAQRGRVRKCVIVEKYASALFTDLIVRQDAEDFPLLT